MTEIELLLEIREQARFLARLNPHGEAAGVARGYLVELVETYMGRYLFEQSKRVRRVEQELAS